MKLFGSKPNASLDRYPAQFTYRVTCAFLEWTLTIALFSGEPVVTYQWIKGERNRHTTIVLENSIRRMCNSHGVPMTLSLKEVFPEWNGNTNDEPGFHYKMDGYLLANFEPSLHEEFHI